LVGQFVGLVLPHEHSGEEDRMEWNVVFADKMDQLTLWVEPIFFPFLRGADLFRPFLGSRNIADRRIKPDVKDFIRIAGNWNAPIRVASDGAGFEILDILHCKMDDVVLPLLFRNPLCEGLFELVKAQVEVIAWP